MPIWSVRVALAGLHERPPSLDLLEAQKNQPGHDEDPVDVVGDDRAVGGRVVPAQDGVEDAPAAAAVQLGIAALETRQL